MRDIAERLVLAEYGIVTPETAVYAEDGWSGDFQMAQDAQPTLITTSNAGIPAFLTNVIDPEVIRVLVAPMRAVEILGGEQKRGTWTDLTAQFPIVEAAGQVSSYGDFNNNGSTDANVNFVPRQSYHFQTITTYGERQLDFYGKARISYKNELDVAAALVMSKFMNRSYFFGVGSLGQNFGLLNDPSLIAPIAPTTKAAGGTTWPSATAQEIYNDVLALFGQLVTQMGGNLVDMDTEMTLALSPGRMPFLSKVSQFNVTAKTTVMENFPNLRIVSAPEYSTTGGELMQLIVNRVDGAQTAFPAFTEKMRAHPVIAELSGFRQKKSGGTWGTIIRRPIAIAQMLGI